MSFRKRIPPIIRDTGPDSVAIVVYGSAKYSVGVVKINDPVADVNFDLTLTLPQETDYSARFTFENLTPNTEYHYISYCLPPSQGYQTFENLECIKEDSIKYLEAGKFRTSDPGAKKFIFAFGSCRYFLQPLVKLSIGSHLSDRAFRSIDYLLENGPLSERPQMLLTIGDQVYTDTINKFPWLRIKSEEKLRALHRSARSTPGFTRLSSTIEVKAIEDDHAYRDNGNPDLGATEPEVYANCLNMVNIYDHPEGPFPKEDNPRLDYNIHFKRGPASFYLLDTRYSRSDEYLLSEADWSALEEWLSEDTDEIKFLVSPVPVFLQKYDDTWAGYPQEQHRLVHNIVKHGLKNFFILSGDAHSSVSTEFTIYRDSDATRSRASSTKFGDNSTGSRNNSSWSSNASTGLRIVEILSSGFLSLFHDKPKNFFNEVSFTAMASVDRLDEAFQRKISSRTLSLETYLSQSSMTLSQSSSGSTGLPGVPGLPGNPGLPGKIISKNSNPKKAEVKRRVTYHVASKDSLEELRSRVISRNSFAIVSVSKNSVRVKYRTRKGKSLYQQRYSIAK